MLRRVGLLGGSFNPAHDGHRYLSELALAHLQLHQVWWVISPQNPLKASGEIAPFAERRAVAESVAHHSRIRVTDIERKIGTTHTLDTVAALQVRFPDTRFVWLMGADIMIELPKWKQWQRLLRRVPIAVFPRPTYSSKALSSMAARYFAGARVPQRQAPLLAGMEPPAWVFLQIRPHGESATRIRARRNMSSDGGDPDEKFESRREPKSSPQTPAG